MESRLVFRPTRYKRALAWGFLALSSCLHIALIGWLVLNWRTQPPDERWSGVGVAALLLFPVALAAAFLRSYFVLTPDAVEVVRPFGVRRFPVSGLTGYGWMTLVVNLVPMHQVRIYGAGLKMAAAIPVNGGDRGRVDAWFRRRLRLVVDDGSIAIPKPRYADPG
jgi:hypothetical protein